MNELYWAPADCFCPGCGSQQTWVENTPGDYYVGPMYVCLGCESTGYLWEAEPIGERIAVIPESLLAQIAAAEHQQKSEGHP